MANNADAKRLALEEAAKKNYVSVFKSANDSTIPGTATNFLPINLDQVGKQLNPQRTPLQNRGAYGVTTGEKGENFQYRAIAGVNTTKVNPFAPQYSSSVSGRGGFIDFNFIAKTRNMGKLNPGGQVTWELFNQSGPFDGLSAATVASLINAKEMEERFVIGADETALTKPASVTATASDSGGTLPADTYTVRITALSYIGEWMNQGGGTPVALVSNKRQGETDYRASGNAVVGTATGSIAVTWTDVPGAWGYAVYLNDGTDNHYVATVHANGYTITSVPSNTAAAPTADASSEYYYTDPVSGSSSFQTVPFTGMYAQIVRDTDFAYPAPYYVSQANAVLTAGAGGSGCAELDTLFASLAKNAYLSPDLLLMGLNTYAQLSSTLMGSTAPVYRLNKDADTDGDVNGGTVLKGVFNQYMGGRLVEVLAHPLIPDGKVIAYTSKIDYPGSGVPNNLVFHTGTHFQQEFYARTNDSSPMGPWAIKTYGTPCLYMPSACGVINNIKVTPSNITGS